MEDALRMVGSGGCETWPLPGEPTCAGIARRAFRQVAGGLALDPALIDDGAVIVSELAANTLHVRGEDRQGGPELWLYLRGTGASRELVCKVFDTYPGWLNGTPSGQSRVPADALSGRGLGVVHELSGGHWGYHLTRARLGGWNLRGKAVWFAVPAPELAANPGPGGPASLRPGCLVAGGLRPGGLVASSQGAMEAAGLRSGGPAEPPPGGHGGLVPPSGVAGGRNAPLRNTASPLRSASEAMAELEAGLAARGFGGTLVRAADGAGDMAVLSVCRGITLWCAGGAAWLRAPGADGRRWGYGDLVELTEQTVEAYETTIGDAAFPQLAGACTGA